MSHSSHNTDRPSSPLQAFRELYGDSCSILKERSIPAPHPSYDQAWIAAAVANFAGLYPPGCSFNEDYRVAKKAWKDGTSRQVHQARHAEPLFAVTQGVSAGITIINARNKHKASEKGAKVDISNEGWWASRIRAGRGAQVLRRKEKEEVEARIEELLRSYEQESDSESLRSRRSFEVAENGKPLIEKKNSVLAGLYQRITWRR